MGYAAGSGSAPPSSEPERAAAASSALGEATVPATLQPPRTPAPWGFWTPEKIVDAIKAHVVEHGQPPTATLWRYADPEQKRPTVDKVQSVFGTWSDGLRAAGVEPRKVGRRPHAPSPGNGGREQLAEKPEQVRQTPPVVWAVKVPGTGLRYRTADEAYVAADEIEHDGERVAREARVAGQEGKADQAIEAARELAEKIRAAAAAVSGSSTAGGGEEPSEEASPADTADAGAEPSGREPSGPAAATAEAHGLPAAAETPGTDPPVALPERAVGSDTPGSRPDDLKSLLVVALRGAADALEALT